MPEAIQSRTNLSCCLALIILELLQGIMTSYMKHIFHAIVELIHYLIKSVVLKVPVSNTEDG